MKQYTLTRFLEQLINLSIVNILIGLLFSINFSIKWIENINLNIASFFYLEAISYFISFSIVSSIILLFVSICNLFWSYK